jgi:tRNA threonylcarbamoyl adenosine modification protein YeaZ
MKILGLEMSTARGSIAWRENGKALFDCQFAADRKHSGQFFENVQICVERFGQPDQIVIGLGPGSYAGVRIAIAAAIGLGAAAKARLTGIPSICGLEVAELEYCVIGDARRQSFFFARVQNGNVVEGPVLESALELATRLRKSTVPVYSSEELPHFPTAKRAYPAAGRLVEVGAFHADKIDGVLEPIYLREPHITVAKATPGLAPTK